MKKVSRYQVCVIVVLVLFFSSLLITSEKHPKKGDIRSTEKTVVSWAKRAYQGFNLRMWLSNQSTVGIGAWDGDVPVDYVVNCGYGIGVSYPYTSCVEHVYGAGPIIGAKIDGVRYVTEGYNGNAGDSYFLPERKDTARDKFWFTSIDNWQSENRSGIDDDADGSIDEDELDGTDNDGDWNIALDDLGADNLADTNETGCKGVYDPLLNPDPAYDNYDATGVKRDTCHPNALGQFPKMNHKDLYTQGNGMPDHGESHVDEDYGALSQSDYYCSYTDTFKSPTYPNHKSMGIKVWQKSYAWKKGTAADAMIIHEYYVVNVGKKTLRDMYLGYFADMDIGPLSVAGYYQYNYSAFDASTKTAYTHNPVHNGSTPLGLTLLQAAKPFDSLQLMFQPHDFDPPCGGTSDSSLYDCLSCETFSGSCIAENESPHSLHDTRFTTSHGPYETMNPGDTVKMVYAFVSGESIREMLNNARRAERIWKSGGFIMPLVQVYDSGSGRPITLTWGSIARSPFGNVVSYKILYGTELGVYSDSIIVNDTTVTMNLPSGLVYNFVVRAIDEHGNESADSDEMNNIPQTPFHLSATGGDVSILIDWDDNPDADLLG
ncbi:MAG: hypothetical protein HYZ34_14285, partial [Ignavibacteriae bacterium]|nr:hypothetical protein [Ignavibacteriota bacterium]